MGQWGVRIVEYRSRKIYLGKNPKSPKTPQPGQLTLTLSSSPKPKHMVGEYAANGRAGLTLKHPNMSSIESTIPPSCPRVQMFAILGQHTKYSSECKTLIHKNSGSLASILHEQTWTLTRPQLKCRIRNKLHWRIKSATLSIFFLTRWSR